jgi:hypothetical protein
MSKERRNGKPPVPDNIRALLSIEQKKALAELEGFGWVIDYVRRPLFQQPRVIMRDPKSGKVNMILEDGTVDYNPQEVAKRADE